MDDGCKWNGEVRHLEVNWLRIDNVLFQLKLFYWLKHCTLVQKKKKKKEKTMSVVTIENFVPSGIIGNVWLKMSLWVDISLY